MPNDQDGNIQVEEIQPSAIPTENQTTDEVVGLPTDVSARTKEQFDKLTEHNKQLAEENARLKAGATPVTENSVFDSFRIPESASVPTPVPTQFPGLTTNQVNDVLERLVDKDGYVDQKILVDTLKELRDKVTKAETETQRAKQEYERIQENEQVQRAHSKYPQLDPKSKSFDPNFFNAVKNELIGQMIQGNKDMTGAADKVASWYKTEIKSDQSQSEAQKKQDQVRQINAIGSSTGRGSYTPSSDEVDLVKRTRAGDQSALMERLKRAGL